MIRTTQKKNKKKFTFFLFLFTFIGGWLINKVIDKIIDSVIGKPVDTMLEYSFDAAEAILKPSYDSMNEYLKEHKNTFSKNTLKELQTKAQNGDLQAQLTLGNMYYFGEYIAKDYKEAIKWWLISAERGGDGSQFNLGVMYANGWGGVSQDYKEAIKWFLKAAEQGYVGAQCELGRMYVNGWGVSQDYKEAAKWWRKAIEQGHSDAQLCLAFMYYEGLGVKQDYKEAIKWYLKATELGHTDAKEKLKELTKSSKY